VAAAARELPNNVEAEQALLGAILVNNTAYERVKQFLRTEHFYEPLHQKIYMLCEELIETGKLASPFLLKSFLPRDAKVGDLTMVQYLVALASNAIVINNAREFGRAIHDMWLRREAINAGEAYLNQLYDAPAHVDPIGERSDFEDRIAWLRSERIGEERRRGPGQIYLDHLDEQEKLGQSAGVPLFMNEIGRIICEPTFAPGRLYGLAASSGEGKTSWVLQEVIHALEQGHPVQIQSFDQSNNEFMAQMIAQLHMIEARRQAMLHITPKEREKIVDFSLWIDQQPFQIIQCTKNETAAQLVTRAREFVRKRGNGKTPLVVTDHIQAIAQEAQPANQRRRDGGETEGTKVKAINQIIKTGAKSLGAAWMMLNQRNTLGTVRPNPRPIPSDVHGGQAALYSYDTMIYLYRFKKFYEERKRVAVTGKDFSEIEKVFPSDVRQGGDIVEMGALKIRFGDVYQDAARLDFEAKYTRYVDKQQAANDQEELAMFLASSR